MKITETILKELIREELESSLSEQEINKQLVRKMKAAKLAGVPIICDSSDIRAKLVSYLEENRIQTRMYFAGNILLHPGYKELDDASKYPIANTVLEKVFFIWCTPTYSDSMIDYIKEVLQNYKLSCANS